MNRNELMTAWNEGFTRSMAYQYFDGYFESGMLYDNLTPLEKCAFVEGYRAGWEYRRGEKKRELDAIEKETVEKRMNTDIENIINWEPWVTRRSK